VKAAIQFVATLGPVGYSPVAPATAASFLVVLAGWFIPPLNPWVVVLSFAVGTALAVWITGRAEQDLGRDAHAIVADEVLGQSLALLGVPHAWPAYLASLVLFRIFDIWKPLGARQAQSLVGGLGVVGDDVIAGFTACAVFHLGSWGVQALGWVK
jgi:phosphatidylglycerophosphatase A